VRARLTLVVSAGLAVTLAAGAVLLFTVLRLSLTRGLDDTARQGAREVAALAEHRDLPKPVPVADSTLSVQVLDASGQIYDVSLGADRLVPLMSFGMARSLARTGGAVQLNGASFGIPAMLRVVAVPTSGDGVVIAAVSYAEVSDSLYAVGVAAAVGTPLLFLLLVLVTWLVTGAALRPIEELSRGAQEITGTGAVLAQSLPEPEARDEVHGLAVTLNGMLARLEAARQRQRAFIADAAHELRSPIASMRTQLEVGVDHPEVVDWPATAAGVLADTLRLTRLTEDLLALARLDERADRPTPGRPVDLAALAADVCARYADARVPVTADGTGGTGGTGGCVVAGEAGGLDRLLVNLIDNAVRYAGRRVTVCVRGEGPWVLLSVTDDGPGIPERDAERVFDRFTRLDDARSREGDGYDGSGLGLAIVRATATAHGGTAWLEDAGLRSAGLEDAGLRSAGLEDGGLEDGGLEDGGRRDADRGLRAVVRLPAAPGQHGGDRDRGEQQREVGDREVEQAHRGGPGH
jgi:signal transduction histidine kinase